MDMSHKVLFPVLLVLLVAIVGLNFVADDGESSFFSDSSVSGDYLTGAVVAQGGEVSLSAVGVSASCWNYSTSATCSADSNCDWKDDI